MKVLHLTSGNLYGGIETYLLTLARFRHLCPTMEPHFGLCFPGRIRDELTATGVGVHDLGPVRVPAGKVLLLGDNRGNSRDGRTFGFVDRERVLGRAFAVVARDGHAAYEPL